MQLQTAEKFSAQIQNRYDPEDSLVCAVRRPHVHVLCVAASLGKLLPHSQRKQRLLGTLPHVDAPFLGELVNRLCGLLAAVDLPHIRVVIVVRGHEVDSAREQSPDRGC